MKSEKFSKAKSLFKGRKVKFCELLSIQAEESIPIDIHPPFISFHRQNFPNIYSLKFIYGYGSDR